MVHTDSSWWEMLEGKRWVVWRPETGTVPGKVFFSLSIFTFKEPKSVHCIRVEPLEEQSHIWNAQCVVCGPDVSLTSHLIAVWDPNLPDGASPVNSHWRRLCRAACKERPGIMQVGALSLTSHGKEHVRKQDDTVSYGLCWYSERRSQKSDYFILKIYVWANVRSTKYIRSQASSNDFHRPAIISNGRKISRQLIKVELMWKEQMAVSVSPLKWRSGVLSDMQPKLLSSTIKCLRFILHCHQLVKKKKKTFKIFKMLF